MSFISPQKQSSYKIPNNSSTPYLSSNSSKNQSLNQLSDKKSLIISSFDGIAPIRKSNNYGFGQISNEHYGGNGSKSGNTGNKLNEMSSDLAKLK